jgi:hypothetical protein
MIKNIKDYNKVNSRDMKQIDSSINSIIIFMKMIRLFQVNCMSQIHLNIIRNICKIYRMEPKAQFTNLNLHGIIQYENL